MRAILILFVVGLATLPAAASAQCFGHGSQGQPVRLTDDEVRAILLSRLLTVEPPAATAKALTSKDVENALVLLSAKDVGTANFRDRLCGRLKRLITRLELLHARICAEPAPVPTPVPPQPAPITPAPKGKAKP